MADLARGIAALLGLTLVTACGNGTSKTNKVDPFEDDRFDRRAMLVDQAAEVVRPEIAAFSLDATALDEAVAAWVAAGAKADGRAAAQSAWKAAFLRWQRLEVWRFGPAAMDDNALRDRIYSWPVTSACAVDQATAACDPAKGCDATVALVNRKGLDALEALLFRDGTDHACPPQAAPAGWDALDEAARWARRGAWAKAVAADLRAAATTLHDGWKADGGDYVTTLAKAGELGNPFPSLREAVNHWSDALFYVDTETKTMKLGQPPGIVANPCGLFGEPCAQALESRWAHLSKEAIVANVQAFRIAVIGRDKGDASSGPGIKAWLTAVGAGELAGTLTAQTDACLSTCQAIPGTLAEALVKDPDAVKAAFEACRSLGITMKTSLATTLGLDLPDSAAADAD